MSQSYEAEQKQLEAEVVALQQIEVQERQHENIAVFIQKADMYVGIEQLIPYVLRELIEGIYVEVHRTSLAASADSASTLSTTASGLFLWMNR